MPQFGCLARYFRPFEEEVAFARRHGFEFLQLWYVACGLSIDGTFSPDLDRIRRTSVVSLK
jgi:hypothetical protein